MKRFTSGRLARAMASRGRLARVIVAVACAGLVTSACDVHGVSSVSGTPSLSGLTSLVVSPNPQTLPINGTQQFTAIGKDFSGATMSVTPTWSIVAGGGSITSSGLFTAGTTTGTFASTVKATAGSISGSATVIVTVGPLASITLTPNPVTIGVSTTQQYVAVGKDAGGNVVAITPTWAVVAGGGSINSTGLFTAGSVAGTFTNTIQASSGGISATATVIEAAGALATIAVTPNPVTLNAGGSQQFTAVGRDAGGNVVPITPVWTVAAGGGTINATGVFTAGAVPGTYTNTVTATSGALSGTATVIVAAGAPTTITVTPNPVSLTIGAPQQFVAVGRDGAGNIVAITPVWAVVAGGGVIDAVTGQFTAGNTPGTFTNTVRASVGAVSGFATVTVTSGGLATITVTPNPATVNTNGAQQFVAVGRDAGGNVLAVTPTWSVVNGGGSINASTGLFTAGGVAGTFTNTIQATSGAISGVATVNVVATPALATITVLPNPAQLLTGAAQQFVATGRDQFGNIFPIVPVWTVVAGGGAINATGLFTAGAVAGTFTNTVQATVGAKFGTATVIVTAAAPALLVNLGAAGPNGIMAGTAFTCVSLGTIFADIALSPGSTVTGFPPCVITGVQHLNDATAIQAQIDLTAAYNVLAGLPCPAANAIVANLGGTTKPAGVYCTGSGIGITGTLTLDGGGNPNANFVFQAGTGLTTAGNIVLINGAQAKNVYFQVGSSATIGTASQMQGNILALTSITLVDNATLTGRALARNGAVSMGTGNVIILP